MPDDHTPIDAIALGVHGSAGVAPSPPEARANAPARQSSSPSPTLVAGAPLRLGFITLKPQTAQFFGVDFVTPDMKPIIHALIDELNGVGGIAGRHVEAVVHEVALSTTPDAAARTHEEACVHLAEDEHVFLVVSLDSNGVAAAGCYANHEMPYIDATVADDALLRELHPWILPSPKPSLDSSAQMYVRALARQGFFAGPIGLWIYDTPEYRATAKSTLLPLIEAMGGNVVSTFTGQLGDGESAILRFRSAGVDRIMIWDFGQTWLELALAASSQRWRPRWAINSSLTPQWHAERIPAEQLPGTVGAGWEPIVDVPDSELPLTDRERWCFDVVGRRSGIRYASRSSDNNGAAFTLLACELIEVVRAGLGRAGSARLNAAGVWPLVAGLGDPPPGVTPPQTFFTMERLDGARRYADLAYVEACSCFRYQSGWRDFLTE
jgi:hypothetical protein